MNYTLNQDKTQVYKEVKSMPDGDIVLEHATTGSKIKINPSLLKAHFSAVEQVAEVPLEIAVKPKQLTLDEMLDKGMIAPMCEHLFITYQVMEESIKIEVCLKCKQAYGLLHGEVKTFRDGTEFIEKFKQQVNIELPTIEHFPVDGKKTTEIAPDNVYSLVEWRNKAKQGLL